MGGQRPFLFDTGPMLRGLSSGKFDVDAFVERFKFLNTSGNIVNSAEDRVVKPGAFGGAAESDSKSKKSTRNTSQRTSQ